MSERVNLPPGCAGFNCADGTVYKAKAGTSVVLEDRHAAALSASQHSSIGLVKSGESFTLGTKAGRYCGSCARLWQAWSANCPKCGVTTIPVGAAVTPQDGENPGTGISPEPGAPSASTQSTEAMQHGTA